MYYGYNNYGFSKDSLKQFTSFIVSELDLKEPAIENFSQKYRPKYKYIKGDILHAVRLALFL